MCSNGKKHNGRDFFDEMTVGDIYSYVQLAGHPWDVGEEMTVEQIKRALKSVSVCRNLPKRGESAAVSIWLPKTSALCYDRVFGFPGADIPEEIRFGGGTEGEVGYLVRRLFLNSVLGGKKLAPGVDEFIGEHIDASKMGVAPETRLVVAENQCISIAYARECGIPVVPVFHMREEGERLLHEPGDARVIVTTLNDLAIIDEEKIVWEQVQQFREDEDVRKKYRRLIHWLDAEMVSKTQAFIRDEISKRLDDYEWALKKHGIETLIGSISDVLDGKFLAGASATGAVLSLLDEPGLAALTATGLVLSKAIVGISERLVALEDIRRGPNSEVAYIHEARKQLEGD